MVIASPGLPQLRTPQSKVQQMRTHQTLQPKLEMMLKTNPNQPLIPFLLRTLPIPLQDSLKGWTLLTKTPAEATVSANIETMPKCTGLANLAKHSQIDNNSQVELFAGLVDPEDSYPDFALTSSLDAPTWGDAMSGRDKDKWLAVKDVKLGMIEKMKTWSIVPQPPNVNIIPSHYICKIK